MPNNKLMNNFVKYIKLSDAGSKGADLFSVSYICFSVQFLTNSLILS